MPINHLDDDEDYPPEGGCIGTGHIQEMGGPGVRSKIKHPIGFVHFPDKPPAGRKTKARKVVKAKRRKR